MRKIISLVMALLVLVFLVSCGENNNQADTTKTDTVTNVTPTLKFKDALSFEYLQSLNGNKVEISGYIATSSPVNGSFIFLMNLPYQSCPFCVPNTSQLANTLEVYPKSSQKFSYTSQAVKVTGTLMTAANEGEYFTDDYGYEFNVKIVDAEYYIIPASELSEEYVEWQKIAESGIVDDLYRMYDYLNFVCAWNEYYAQGRDKTTGKLDGYYLWPSDALDGIYSGQFSYGHQEGYFEDIIERLRSFGSKKVVDLINNVDASRILAEDAVSKLENGEFEYEDKYLEQWDKTDKVYTIIGGDELMARWKELYRQFSEWISGWEM